MWNLYSILRNKNSTSEQQKKTEREECNNVIKDSSDIQPAKDTIMMDAKLESYTTMTNVKAIHNNMRLVHMTNKTTPLPKVNIYTQYTHNTYRRK